MEMHPIKLANIILNDILHHATVLYISFTTNFHRLKMKNLRKYV